MYAHTHTHIHTYICIYLIYEFLYIFDRMGGYLRPVASCRFYTAIIRLKKKDFGEIEKIEKIQSKDFLL